MVAIRCPYLICLPHLNAFSEPVYSITNDRGSPIFLAAVDSGRTVDELLLLVMLPEFSHATASFFKEFSRQDNAGGRMFTSSPKLIHRLECHRLA
jgi:hypothetical protein